MQQLTSSLRGIDGVFCRKQLLLGFAQTLLASGLCFDCCELLRSVATTKRKEQIPARAWLHSIALDCQIQLPHAELVSYDPLQLRTQHTPAVQICDSATLEDPVRRRTFVVAFFTSQLPDLHGYDQTRRLTALRDGAL